jgi:flagellar motility protein MotE (MotC chaperone)
MALDESILQAVANANFKTMAEMATQNAITHQQRLQLISESSLGQILNRMNALDPEESASIAGVVSSDLAEKIGELSGAVAASQQLMKGAQSTPPVT